MSKNKGGLFKFVAGIGLGVGLGMLFAPEKGAETRKKLMKKLNEMCDSIKNRKIILEENVLENANTKELISKRPELPKIDYDKVGDAIALFGKILPAMWW